MNLFTPIIPQNKQHKHFRYITETGLCEPEIEVIKNWADEFIDRNGNLVKQFQTDFNSTFWELYLFACFKELGCTVDLSYETPDFFVKSQYGDFIAEAAIANNPKNFRPEWEKDYDLIEKADMKEVIRLSTIRLESSIQKKIKKYRQNYSKLNHVKNKPFVICVAPFDQPFFYFQDSLAIAKVLYGIEEVMSTRDSNGEISIVGVSYNYRFQSKPGFNRNLGLFTNSKFKEVSAVIFSNRATFCKVRALSKDGKYPVIFQGCKRNLLDNVFGLYPFTELKQNYKESLIDGLHILVNPFADNVLDLSIFKEKEIAIHNYDPESREYISYIPNNFLLQRTCMVIHKDKNLEEFKKRTQENYEELKPEKWEEDQLVRFGGFVGNLTHNYLSHYKEWTIMVSFDSTNQKWTSRAVQKLFYSISELMEETKNKSSNPIFIEKLFLNKEQVYDVIKNKINQFLS